MKNSLLDSLKQCLERHHIAGNDASLKQVWANLQEDDIEYRDTLEWIQAKQQECQAEVKRIDLRDVLNRDWSMEPKQGDIVHKSGGFFRIIGVRVETDQRENGRGWDQPMLDQGTESSIAGFIVQNRDATMKYLVEAKFEPGNYNRVLISPSLQATYSNLDRAHGGSRPRLAEYFDGSDPSVKCLYEQWLPEDGGRFYLKRVKYMIVEITRDTEIRTEDNFRWVSVNTLKRLLWLDNLVNPHVRSLLAVL